jgi:hypothetical protein
MVFSAYGCQYQQKYQQTKARYWLAKIKGRVLAAGTPRAVPVFTIAPLESNPALTRKPGGIDVDNSTQVRGGISCVSPPLCPHDAVPDTYLVRGDFGGQFGCGWRETDAESLARG